MIATHAREQQTLQIKPTLKWAGGKRWQLPHLRPYWQAHSKRRLVEPFCGGLAVSLGLMPRRAYLNDINPHTINFYRWLKRGLVIRLPMANDQELYYQHRDRFNKLQTNGKRYTSSAASLFYFLNRTGYNGLCRFNQRGEFNVPFGRYTNINYSRDFTPFKSVFQDWVFQSTDFEKLKLNPSDFIYADPPYDVQFTHYSKEGFTWDEYGHLAVATEELSRCRSMNRELDSANEVL